jgi:hypothetical protein
LIGDRCRRRLIRLRDVKDVCITFSGKCGSNGLFGGTGFLTCATPALHSLKNCATTFPETVTHP